MSMAEIVGYVAALVTLGTYSMKTMIPLRMFGIAANVLFIAFGYMAGIYPTLILHVVLLPLNSLRLYQMLQLTRRVIEARTPVASAGVRSRPSLTQKIEHVGPSSTVRSERTSRASS